MTTATLGQRLRMVLADRGMSMAALSDRASLPYTSVQNYASDKQMPGAEALMKIRSTLSVNVDWLLSGEGMMNFDGSDHPDRLMSIQDVTEISSRFSNFDEIFSVKDILALSDFQDLRDRLTPEALSFLRERMNTLVPTMSREPTPGDTVRVMGAVLEAFDLSNAGSGGRD